MKSWMICVLLASLSVWSMAEPNHGGHKKGGLFKWADTDKNGSISMEEHQAATQKMADKRHQRFIALDVDGDGSVTKDEASKMHNKKHGKRKDKTAKH